MRVGNIKIYYCFVCERFELFLDLGICRDFYVYFLWILDDKVDLRILDDSIRYFVIDLEFFVIMNFWNLGLYVVEGNYCYIWGIGGVFVKFIVEFLNMDFVNVVML